MKNTDSYPKCVCYRLTNINMDAPKSLKVIANKLDTPLYIVGGYVRNKLLWANNPREGDIDICAELTPSEIQSKLVNVAEIKLINPRIGTLKIIVDNEEYEYTCFRKENYPIGGKHTPNEVCFVKNINEDAYRRDFSVNALYLNVLSGEVLDPTGKGLADIKSKSLRTAAQPEKVFGEDGLRLLRLVRFAAELGFSIEAETFEAAKKFRANLSDIAAERKRDELDKILLADKRYNIADAHYQGLKLIGELDLWEFLIPEIVDCIGFSQRPDIHMYDVYNHILEAVRVSPPEIRLASLLHDIGKPAAFKEDGNMYRHSIIGADIAETILKRLRYPNATIQRIKALVNHHMYDMDGLTKLPKLRVFIQNNYEIINDLLKVREADGRATNNDYNPETVNKMRDCLYDMQAKEIPFSLKELDINGIDILELGAINVELSTILKGVLMQSAKVGRRLTREEQLEFALKLLNGY